MKHLAKVVLEDKEITDVELIHLISRCLVETGGIPHVSRNLAEIGLPNFSSEAYSQLDASKLTVFLDFSDISANSFLVICIVIFATVKEVEQATLIATPFDTGIELLRNI